MPFWCEAADIRKEIDWGIMRKVGADHHEVRELFLGDYYPLTPWSIDAKQWIGFQFDRPDLGKGFLQVFRRPENKSESITVKLQGLDPEAKYDLRDLNLEWKVSSSGKTLMNDGLLVEIHTCPGDALIVYKKHGSGK
jgi:alpha-galactosidase